MFNSRAANHSCPSTRTTTSRCRTSSSRTKKIQWRHRRVPASPPRTMTSSTTGPRRRSSRRRRASPDRGSSSTRRPSSWRGEFPWTETSTRWASVRTTGCSRGESIRTTTTCRWSRSKWRSLRKMRISHVICSTAPRTSWTILPSIPFRTSSRIPGRTSSEEFIIGVSPAEPTICAFEATLHKIQFQQRVILFWYFFRSQTTLYHSYSDL